MHSTLKEQNLSHCILWKNHERQNRPSPKVGSGTGQLLVGLLRPWFLRHEVTDLGAIEDKEELIPPGDLAFYSNVERRPIPHFNERRLS